MAAELSLADLLAEGPLSVVELASASGCAAVDGLYRVLRLLASHHVFHEHDDQTFSLTPIGARLRSDVSYSMRDLVIFYGSEALAAWGALLHGVRTGESPFRRVFGDDLFDYLHAHPERGSVFNGAMAASAPIFHHLATAYAFPEAAMVVDVGGGSGAMLDAILAARPDLRGTVVDLPAVVEDARQRMAANAMADRCAFEPADFFTRIPEGGDVYLLSRILHDWDDDRCTDILRNCRAAMKPNSRLLIIERLLPAPNTPSLACEFDVLMLVVSPSGRERDMLTYTRLLHTAGLHVLSVIPLTFDVNIMECAIA
ncbi:MAG: methyltransferase [Actinomycetota bacterium]|nr:methyltransferase [Actinomycetota bacterium]